MSNLSPVNKFSYVKNATESMMPDPAVAAALTESLNIQDQGLG